MVSLEQIKLLESKVTKTIDYVKKVTDENKRLKDKLDSYQVRIDELEVLVLRFKEDQNQIEEGILSALDRLNQFEDAVGSLFSPENKLSDENAGQGKSKKEKPATVIAPEAADKPEPEVAAQERQDSPSPPEPPKASTEKEDQSSEEGELDIF